MEQVELAGDTWVYPLLEDQPTTATFMIDVTVSPPQNLQVGPGIITIGTITYALAFTEGDLRVDTYDTAESFDPIYNNGVRLTRVVTATLARSDGSTFASGGGAFSWSREEFTYGESTDIVLFKYLDLRLVDDGQLYNVRISSGDPSAAQPSTPFQGSSFELPKASKLSPTVFRFRSLKIR